MKLGSLSSTITDFTLRTVKKKKNSAIMAQKIDHPIRMCIVCKERFPKTSLFRYQIKDGKITSFCNVGRSFYICENCLDGNEIKLKKILKAKCFIDTSIQHYGKKLKEISANG